MKASYLNRTVQGSRGSIMIRGVFSWCASGALVFHEGKQTAMRYPETLADQVHLAFYPEGDGYLMNENAPIHQARNVQDWFAEHQSDFQNLS